MASLADALGDTTNARPAVSPRVHAGPVGGYVSPKLPSSDSDSDSDSDSSSDSDDDDGDSANITKAAAATTNTKPAAPAPAPAPAVSFDALEDMLDC